MPEMKSFEIKASQTKAGDLITDQLSVLSVSAKVKWTTIELSDHSTARLENDSIVTVFRSVATAEEKAQERRTAALENLDWADQRARAQLDALRGEMSDRMLNRQPMRSSLYAEIVKLEARVAIFDRLALRSRKAAQADAELMARLELDEDWTLMTVMETVARDLRDELIETVRFTSRSTNTVSNAYDDLVNEAKSEWLRDLRWRMF